MKDRKKISKELKFIKGFRSITLQKICQKLKINLPNLSNGMSSNINEKKVKEEIMYEFGKLLVKDYEDEQ